ncbi:type II secretion system F family protein [Candidatus Micrarchaeota archaeon]|nr:type II secretion system F family protein [Candidatus Micrarchaeota archaeon]
MIEKLEKIIGMFPETSMKFGSANSIKNLGLEINPGKYLSFSIMVSIVIAAIFLLALIVMENYSLLMGVPVAFLLMFAFFLYLPKIEYKKVEQEIEIDLPFFLRTTGIFMEMGISFERALEIAAYGNSALSKTITRLLGQVKMGVGVHTAFSSFSSSFNSLIIKRAVAQLLLVYETGGSGQQIKKLADDMLAAQQHRLKDYSAKSSMFGLIFIMSSAIIPTFFLIYITIGKGVFGSNITKVEVAIAFLLVFPLISFFITLLARSFMPSNPFTNQKKSNPIIFILILVLVMGALLLPEYQLIITAIGIAIAMLLAYRSYIAEKRTEEIEDALPDGVFAIAGMPKATRLDKIFDIMEKSGHGALSKEAEKSKKQIVMNVNPEEVLDDLWARNHSQMLKRFSIMMKQMIKTNSLDKMNFVAEDMVQATGVKRERQNIMAMQKYTLIVGAAIIPGILKIALSLLQNLSGLMGQGPAAGESIAFSFTLIPAYLVIYSAISSVSIADGSGKKSDEFVYFAIMSVLGLVVFNLVSF